MYSSSFSCASGNVSNSLHLLSFLWVARLTLDAAAGDGFLSKEAFRKIRHKQYMWRVYKHTGKDNDYEVYREELNAATNEVRKSKRNFEHKLAQHTKSYSKNFHAYVRSKQNVRDKVGPLEDNILNIIRQGLLMAEELNWHFSSVFTRDDTSSLPVPETKSMDLRRKCWGS